MWYLKATTPPDLLAAGIAPGLCGGLSPWHTQLECSLFRDQMEWPRTTVQDTRECGLATDRHCNDLEASPHCALSWTE